MKELDIVEYVKKRASSAGGDLKVGIGDDCAVISPSKGKMLLWADDMLIEGTHFRLKRDGYRKVGRKAVAVNISDIVSMGGNPEYITVSLALPQGVTSKNIKELYDGILGICRSYGVKVVGGDTNRSKIFIIDVSIIGTVDKSKLITRSGAKKGDLVFITGPVRNGKKHHLDFTPRVLESSFLTGKYKVSAMIDTSDGIGPDLGRLSIESGLGCRIYENKIPLSRGLSLEDALYYGESFELLFTLSGKEAERLKRSKKFPFFCIGEMTPKSEGRVIIGDKGYKPLKMKGFQH